eukprot:4725453-Alexandrium_andersonii.AAC.1
MAKLELHIFFIRHDAATGHPAGAFQYLWPTRAFRAGPSMENTAVALDGPVRLAVLWSTGGNRSELQA